MLMAEGGYMRRRDFMATVGGVMAWPLAANAQQTGKLPTMGFLGAVLLFSRHGRLLSLGVFVSSAGSMAVLLRSSIDGRKGAPSATQKSRRSLSGRKWISLLPLEAPSPR